MSSPQKGLPLFSPRVTEELRNHVGGTTRKVCTDLSQVSGAIASRPIRRIRRKENLRRCRALAANLPGTPCEGGGFHIIAFGGGSLLWTGTQSKSHREMKPWLKPLLVGVSLWNRIIPGFQDFVGAAKWISRPSTVKPSLNSRFQLRCGQGFWVDPILCHMRKPSTHVQSKTSDAQKGPASLR